MDFTFLHPLFFNLHPLFLNLHSQLDELNELPHPPLSRYTHHLRYDHHYRRCHTITAVENEMKENVVGRRRKKEILFQKALSKTHEMCFGKLVPENFI